MNITPWSSIGRSFRCVATGGLVAVALAAGSAARAATPAQLLCEYRENPLGIDVAEPRLSWRLEVRGQGSGFRSQESAVGRVPSPGDDRRAGHARSGDRAYNNSLQPIAYSLQPTAPSSRGVKQTAYQILVASSEKLLKEGKGDLWDSGKVESDQSLQIVYAGKPLTSRMQCYWKVRVWTFTEPRTLNPEPSLWSAPAYWTMGLLEPDDWTAEWIGHDAAYAVSPEQAADDRLFNVRGVSWHHMAGGLIHKDVCFRKEVELPADRPVRRAVLALYAYNECRAAVNGTPIGVSTHWEPTARLDATKALRPGVNAVTLVARHNDPYPPAVIGRLVVQFAEGEDLVVPIDSSWKVTATPGEGWQRPGFDDAAWAKAAGGGYGFGLVADVERVPAPYLRREFRVGQAVKRAVVHVTALGAYELRLNGGRVGEDQLAPGWPDFRKRVYYQTYDVTDQVRRGDNAIGAILGDGWYASVLAHHCRRKYYGGHPRFLAQLEIELADGTVQTVSTDAGWKAATGPIRHADLLMGSEYDARMEMPGWDRAGFDDGAWAPVDAGVRQQGRTDVTARLAAAVKDDRLDLQVTNDAMGGDPIQGVQKVLTVRYERNGATEEATAGENQPAATGGAGTEDPARRVWQSDAGAQSLPPAGLVGGALAGDRRTARGQGHGNAAGPVDVRSRPEHGRLGAAQGARQARAADHVRHGEMINPDGTIYTAALRSCTATDFFILKGGGEEILEPYFTFHGFQHVEVRGLTSPPKLSDLTGIVVHTPMRRTGQFESSHALLNKLYSNIIWGQKGNFLEAPTDCPQRDERMGWTGDTQFFAPTALYNFDGAAFYTRWLEACEDGQNPDGTFPFVIPDIMGGGAATGWGDAALICTHLIYRTYADTRIIEQRYAAMERYMNWLAGRVNAEGITNVGGFGDWLNAGSSAPAPVMDTAYHAYLARIMSEMAAAIGREDDAARYAKRHEETKAAFIKAFVQPDGSLRGCGQTGYALAFTMDLVPDELRAQAAEQYVESVKRHNGHLGTGFIGTPRLLPGLSRAGRDDVACRLLLTDTYPSWLFPVKNGATTMWERWNGWTPDKGFGDIKMNSFNHYAFGAVGEYLYGGVGGIQATSPGYKTIVVRPAVPAPDWDERTAALTWANTSFDSPYGLIVSQWKRDGDALTLEVEIPPNTTAEVHVPVLRPAEGAARAADAVTENGRPAAQSPGVKFLRMERGAAVYAVGSGRYTFESR
jgi:alpha-L-rhamnosidase